MTQTIAIRFNLITSSLVLLLLVLFGVYNQKATEAALNDQLTHQVEAVIKRLQQNLPASMWNYEADQLNRIVDSEVMGAGIGVIIVEDDKGKQLSSREATPDGRTREPSSLPQGSGIEARLTYDDGTPHTVGRVLIYSDDSAIQALQKAALTRTVIQTLLLLVILVGAINLLLSKLVVRPIREVYDALATIAQGEGDLTRRLTAQRDDEIGQLAGAFNQFVGKIQDLVRQVVGSVNQITHAISDMQAITARTHIGVSHQRAETDQAASAMGEMGSSAHEIARSTQQAAASANQADEHSRSALRILGESINAIRKLAGEIERGADVMSDLEKVVADITSVLAVIRGIAEQTNLLALNAAIEAARAGEQGRGFAVVADEVRNLASKTQSSTEEIQHMIQRLQDGTRRAVDVMQDSKGTSERTVNQANHADQALGDVVKAISTINDMNIQIASSAEEQTAVTENINRSLSKIVEIAESTARDTRTAEQASEDLRKLSTELHQMVSRFRV